MQTTRNQSINRLLKTPTIVHAKFCFSVSSAILPFFWWLIWRLGLYATVSFLLKAQFMWRNSSSPASCVTNNWKRTIMGGSRVPYVFRSGFEATGFKLAVKKWAYNLSGDISISINKKNRAVMMMMMMRWHTPQKSQFPYFWRPYFSLGFNKLGLMRDDVLMETSDVAEAVKRLPPKLYDERQFRLVFL